MRWPIIWPILLAAALSSCFPPLAPAHEHQAGETAERAATVEWLQGWRRPTGKFAGVPHRHDPCCYIAGKDQDCFLVKERRVVDGVLEVFPESEGHPDYDRWYKVDTGVTEDDQKDPRDSPDGRSYVCISGQLVICFVNGSGT